MQGITFNRTFVLVKQSPVRERNDIIKLFVDKLNSERGKYKPLTFIAVQQKLVGMPETHHLYAFYEDCLKATCFSKYFYYKLNPEKYDKKIRR